MRWGGNLLLIVPPITMLCSGKKDLKNEAFERTWNVYIPSPPSHSLLCNLLARAAVERAAATPQQIEPPLLPFVAGKERERETETSDSERERTYVRRRGAPRPLFLPLARRQFRPRPRPPPPEKLSISSGNEAGSSALPPSPLHSGDGRRASGICTHRHSRSHRLRHRCQRVRE